VKVEAVCSTETSADFHRTIISQKIELFIATAVRTSNLMYYHYDYYYYLLLLLLLLLPPQPPLVILLAAAILVVAVTDSGE
jgi:dolichol kinase